MALLKQPRRNNFTGAIYRIATSEGTFDLLRTGDTLHPARYWMRRHQMHAFGAPEITKAIEKKRWSRAPLGDQRYDFVFCDAVTVAGERPPRKRRCLKPLYY